MSHNNQKKIAVINDFSGFGRCSIAVALPIISKLKIQCCPVPTSIFSNHTGFEQFFFDDYTDRMEEYTANWKKLDLHFEGITTGFLGSARQIHIVRQFIQDFKDGHTLVIVDPVMGDYGKAYVTYTAEMCNHMKHLAELADILTPNLTEACILTGHGYHEGSWKQKEVGELAVQLSRNGACRVVITGIPLGGCYIGNYVYEADGFQGMIKGKKIGEERSGTGDIFSAIIAADAVNGVDFRSSVKKAGNFIQKCIARSIQMDIPKTDGVCFEEVLNLLK